MVYWFYGQPGSGKSYVAAIFAEMIGATQYEGDTFHTKADRRAVLKGTFTLERRHAQLARIAKALKAQKGKDAIVTHPLPDKRSRELLAASGGGDVVLIYVRTPRALQLKRLKARKGHHFTPDLLPAWINRHWQEPKGEGHFLVRNSVTKRELKKRLGLLRRRSQKGRLMVQKKA